MSYCIVTRIATDRLDEGLMYMRMQGRNLSNDPLRFKLTSAVIVVKADHLTMQWRS